MINATYYKQFASEPGPSSVTYGAVVTGGHRGLRRRFCAPGHGHLSTGQRTGTGSRGVSEDDPSVWRTRGRSPYAFRAAILTKPRRVNASSTSWIVSDPFAISGARPPVAITRAGRRSSCSI